MLFIASMPTFNARKKRDRRQYASMKRHIRSALLLTAAASAAAFSSRPGNNKLEAAGIKRFKEYNKLCKTCPTLLKPKVATLEEMIMGLSVEERDVLLNNVAQRIQQEQEHHESVSCGARTAEDVYKFQTGVDVKEQQTPTDVEIERSLFQPKKEQVLISKDKILKTRSKFEDTKLKLARTQCLLDYTSDLLATRDTDNNTVREQERYDMDPSIYHCVDELENLSRAELKMQRLKYIAQKTKYEQKLAKYRMKLYMASMKVVTTNEDEHAVVS